MMVSRTCGLLLCAVCVTANSGLEEMGKNPIRKVVKMLQQMQAKVTAEGEAEEKLYEKFMCYCKQNGGDGALGASISAAENKIPEVEASIREMIAKKAQTEAELKDHIAGRQEAKSALAKAEALREKEAKAYAAAKADFDANIGALSKALTALSKGMAGGFLQTTNANIIKKIALSGPSMSDSNRKDLLAFLAQKGQYAPQSGEISGILQTIKDDMEQGLADATSDENAAIASFKELTAAKTKEVQTLTEAIETKTQRVGDLAVSIAQSQNDLENTQEALADDKKFLADLSKNCADKTADWETRSATRAEELVAIAETIKVLNSDDALELFKKTLPSAALIQFEATADKLKKKAIAVLQKFSSEHPKVKAQVDFVTLALKGKKGFDKVLKMIELQGSRQSFGGA